MVSYLPKSYYLPKTSLQGSKRFSEKHRLLYRAVILIVLLICFKMFFTQKESCVSKKLAAEKSKQVTIESVTLTIPSQDLPWWDDPELRSCKVSNIRDTVSILDFKKYPVPGNCGYRSFLKGYNQSVVSFSLFGTNDKYWNMLNGTFHDTLKYYPGWEVRVYLNPRIKKDYLCKMLLFHQHVSICDVKNLPPPLGNIESSLIPTLWRSAPMGDPTVSRLAVRDTESVVSISLSVYCKIIHDSFRN